MAKQTAEIVPGEVDQAQWDAKYDTTTKALKDMGGTDSKDSDDLPEGAANKYDTGAPPASTDELTEGTTNKYDTGAPPASTDELTEGSTNKYDTGAPPSDLDGLPDGTTRKAMSSAEKTKLTGIEDDATADQTGAEIRDAVVALGDTERKILITEPLVGEYKVIGVHRNAAGNLEYDYDDVPEE